MIKIISIIVLALLFSGVPGALLAQDPAKRKVDSLLNILKTAKDDTNKVNTLNVLSEKLWRTAESPQGMKYAQEALRLAEKLKFNSGIAWAYENIGLHHGYQGNYPEALKNFFTALKTAENLKDRNEIAYCYLCIGGAYQEQGVAQTNDSLRKELVNGALKYNLAALKITKETGHKRNACISYNDIGVVYRDQGNNSEALKNFLASLKIAEELGAKRDIAITSLNIAGTYRDLGEYDKAMEMASNAMKAATEVGDRRGISRSYSSIGKSYYGLKENHKAREFLTKGLALAKEIGDKDAIEGDYESITELDSAECNWKAAYQNHKLMILYRDSLNNEASREKIGQAQMQYEFDKKEDSLKQKQLLTQIKFQTQKKQKSFYLAGALLLALLSFLIFLNFRNQRKINRLMKETHAQEKAELELHSLRAQLNPHFMFNSLNAIQELILREDFDNSHIYLARFAKLLRMLVENADKPFLALQTEIDFLELYLSLETLRIPDLQYSITIDKAVNTSETIIPNMILQPYIENAIWHGLSHKSGNRKLELTISKENSFVTYSIKDNGVGRKKSIELNSLYRKQHKSRGMELLTKRFKLLSEEYGSEIKTEVSDVVKSGETDGTVVSIAVPDLLSHLKTSIHDTHHYN